MRWFVVAMAGLVLGCPTEAVERDGWRVLDMSSCTRTSRLVASINCEPGMLVCFRGVVEPAECARMIDPISGRGCPASKWDHLFWAEIFGIGWEDSARDKAAESADITCGYRSLLDRRAP